MTLAERIKSQVDKLKPVQQRTLLNVMDAMQKAEKQATRRGKARKSEILAAVRGIAGMWKDRDDLPKDSVEAVKAAFGHACGRGAEMADTLVDATIIIDATNKHSKALAYISDLLLAGEAATHAQVAAEVLSGTRDSREQSRLSKFLRQFKLVHPNELDSQAALHYLQRFHLSHDLGFGDCLIGATALRLSLPVATINDRHFRLFKGLVVVRPY